jgi:predicted RND superfamily exporter protein
MNSPLLRLYDKLVLQRPIVTLLLTLAVTGFFIWQIPEFKLDASGDSLILENDADLYYHRQITDRYGTQDVLVITYTAKQDLFSEPTLKDLKELRDELQKLDGVTSVTTILDVPLLISTDVAIKDLANVENIKTLEKSDVSKDEVLAELRDNPLYEGRLLSSDEKTTALLVNLAIDETYRTLLNKRYQLREKEYNNELSPEGAEELEEVTQQYRQHLTKLQHNESRLIESVREVMDHHRSQADLYLGGISMITSDMISFIKYDLVVFGVGVFIFLVITLTIIFRKKRWVMLSILCCGGAILIMIGWLGMVDWRVTVISSNFISLMLILTMSLTIHLIVRYREVAAQSPDADQRTLVLETVRTIVLPCLYTTLTTIVAFISLLVSDIRPVMDFGMMMTMGLIVSFTLAFVLFPATVVLLGKDTSGADNTSSDSEPFTLIFARFVDNHGRTVLLLSLLFAVLSGLGITKLKVENRFIDYFREKTEIYQGMSLIDRKLGGTTPLDLIVDFKQAEEPDDEFAEEDPWDDFGFGETTTYWFADVTAMRELEKIHDYLVSLPETGEVLSMATVNKIATKLNGNRQLDNFELALLNKKAPQDIKELLVNPYVSEDIPQARFTMRIIESDKNLERGALLDKIRNFLTDKMKLTDDQIHFTNMYVLYNNLLQSLFTSQILTIGMVFLGIFAMFVVLFRSLYLAAIATVPNALPVAMVLGTMGWLDISLDMMTITIASITIGIAVDDTIHYVHRFQREFKKDRNYMATVYRCHRSIGRAMYYTSVTITIGFSILVLSNFIPTIYFGLFTGFAMIVALLANITLLPKLLVFLKPLGPEGRGMV